MNSLHRVFNRLALFLMTSRDTAEDGARAIITAELSVLGASFSLAPEANSTAQLRIPSPYLMSSLAACFPHSTNQTNTRSFLEPKVSMVPQGI